MTRLLAFLRRVAWLTFGAFVGYLLLRMAWMIGLLMMTQEW